MCLFQFCTDTSRKALTSMQVAWEQKDLLRFDPPSAPILGASTSASTTADNTMTPATGAEATGAGTGPTSISPTPSASTAASRGSGGLSTGAKAGIGVGVALGVLIIMGLVIWALLLRRKLKRQAAAQSQPAPAPQSSVSTFQHGAYQGQRYKSPGQQNEGLSSVGGLSSQNQGGWPPAEMSTNPEPSELAGGWQGIRSEPVYR